MFINGYVLREEPCTDPYARFCGQTEAAASSDPIPLIHPLIPEAGCQRRDLFRVDVVPEADLLHMNLEDLDTPLLVRSINEDLAIEPPGTQQRGIENFRPVSRCEQHNPSHGSKPSSSESS